MSNEIKWADVAHMYIQSNIDAEVKRTSGEMSMIRKLGIYDVLGNRLIVTPILRHLADMTEAEAIELYNFVFHYGTRETKVKICLGWAKKHILVGKFSPLVFHWLIQKGFDLFGLIESGQAIRKETHSPARDGHGDTVAKFTPNKTTKLTARITKISNFQPKNEDQE